VVRCPVVILNRPLRIALLSYRSKPHCGGQGIYVRHLTRELHALGHHVEVFSGQPYPELDEGPVLHEVPSLDLYRDEDPFRTPGLSEFRDLVDVLEVATMWTAGFPEPRTFGLRVARLLRARLGDFDVVPERGELAGHMAQVDALAAAVRLAAVGQQRHPQRPVRYWRGVLRGFRPCCRGAVIEPVG